MLKAIETLYRGYRFRSRLEARWAVFFDALGVDWQYEPEGFELPGGHRYLPDFKVGPFGLWVEVKPHGPSQIEVLKARLLADGLDREVFITRDDPEKEGDLLFGPEAARFHGEVRKALLRNCLGTDAASKFDAAVLAFRSARFEFGESGART